MVATWEKHLHRCIRLLKAEAEALGMCGFRATLNPR